MAPERGAIDPYDVREADEAWFTSTTICMIPVTRFDFQAVGGGKPGSIYRRLLAAWSEEVGVNIGESGTGSRDCVDAALVNCGDPRRREILRRVEISLDR